MHAFEIDDVGIGPLDSRRLEYAVQVEQQPVPCGRTGGIVDKPDHLLVVPVHEIDLESLDAHFGIELAKLLHLPGEREVAEPEDQPDAPLFAVLHQRRQIESGSRLQRRMVVAAPTVVQNEVAQTVAGCEIDVIFIGRLVDPRREIHAGKSPVVPPLPRGLAGFDPRNIVEPAGRSELPDQIVVREPGILPHDTERPPRQAVSRREGCYERLVLLDHALHAVVTARHDLPRRGRENAFEFVRAASVQEHARIGFEIGVRNADVHAPGRLHEQRQERQAGGVHFAKRRTGVGVLERLHELLAEGQSIVPARGVAHIGHECDGSRSEPEPGLFAYDEHLAGLTRDEAVGHRVVIGPKLQRKSLPEIDHDPVAAILHLPLFINRCVVHLVDPVAPHSGHPAPPAPAFAGNEPESQGRRLQNLIRIRSDGIYDSITASDRDGQRTIG